MDHICNFSKPPPRSNFIPVMTPLPVILIVNLSDISNRKPNEK